MYCPPGASALGGICSLSTGKIYLLNFLYIATNSSLLVTSTPFLILNFILTISCLLFSRFYLHGLLHFHQCLCSAKCKHAPCIVWQSHWCMSLSNYPCVGFILLHPCLLSCLTCALKVCARGLPQGAQIPPRHPPFLYLHALKKILVVKLQVGLN